MSCDPFTLLGLPRSFDIDPGVLQAAYLRRAAALHPDRLTDPLAQTHAQREAAALNDARAALADDEQRANVLLALLGGPAKDQDKSLPEGFLIEMMEVREAMDAALATGDAAERDRLDRWAREHRQAHVENVRAGFAGLGAAPAPGQLAALRRELNAWRYIERMLQQLRDA
jgi:molecular chaperone HscB